MLKISINTIIDGKEIQNYDEYIIGKIQNYEKSIFNKIENIAESIQQSIQNHLETGTSIYGGNVAPNKKGTRIFYETGTLFNSLRRQKINNGYEIFLDSARSEIGKYLQQGRKNMPARPFFGIDDIILNKITQELQSVSFK